MNSPIISNFLQNIFQVIPFLELPTIISSNETHLLINKRNNITTEYEAYLDEKSKRPFLSEEDDKKGSSLISFIGKTLNVLSLFKRKKITKTPVVTDIPESETETVPFFDYEEYVEEHFNKSSMYNVLKPALPWPNAIVPYFMDLNFTRFQKETIAKAMEDIKKISCVRFVPGTVETHGLMLAFDDNYCTSAIGWHPKVPTVVHLDDGCLSHAGDVTRLLLQSLGFDYPRLVNPILGIPETKDTILVRKIIRLPYSEEHVADVNDTPRANLSRSDIGELNRFYRCDPDDYYMGDDIAGAIKWDHFRKKFLKEE